MTDLFAALSDREKQMVSLLLPYWGLTRKEGKNEPGKALENETVMISGLGDSHILHLRTLLSHTGVNVKTAYEAEPDGPHFSVQVSKHARAPITLSGGKLTYYLRPLRKKTNDVQSWVHKRLWLPVDGLRLSLTFHTNEEDNIPEWLSYLIIQCFLRSSFQPLSELEFSDYEKLVNTFLVPLNEEFANRQLSIGGHAKEDWPEFPPGGQPGPTPPPSEQNTKDDNSGPLPDDGSAPPNPINPFKKRESSQNRRPFDPFRKTNKPSHRSTINPFRHKRNR